MANYKIINEGQEGRKYVYHCRTGTLDYTVSLLHPLKSANGFYNHLEIGADEAITRSLKLPEIIEETFTASEVTVLLRDKNIIATNETFSKDMITKVTPVRNI